MSAVTVRLSLAERFLNWYARNTTLYFRRDAAERAAEANGVIAASRRHFDQLAPFFAPIEDSLALLRQYETDVVPRLTAERDAAKAEAEALRNSVFALTGDDNKIIFRPCTCHLTAAEAQKCPVHR